MIFKDGIIQDKIPYKTRTTLNSNEILQISHYKDLINDQYRWHYKPDKNEKSASVGMDCFMINSYLRDIFKKPVDSHDMELIMQIMDGLNSAINNSHAPRTFNVIKGVSNPKYLRDLKIGNDFDDFAYGSYSTSEFVARKYASKNPNGTLVYLIQTLHNPSLTLCIF